jgi:hypothetical protein
MLKLKKGEALKVPIPAEVDPMIVANRLTSVMRNSEIKAPEGMTFQKRAGEGHTLVITLAVKRGKARKAK